MPIAHDPKLHAPPFTVRQLKRRASVKAAGFVRAVMAKAIEIEGGKLALSQADFRQLRADWPTIAPAPDAKVQARGAKMIARGAVGLAKNLFGVEQASEEEKARRLEICSTCPNLVKEKTCRLCGCWVEQKTRISGERCPAGHWGPAVTE